MAHFAELDATNTVLRVVVISNDEIFDGNIECEAKGIKRCQELFGANTNWKQTSYNCNMRKNYAGVGYYYDAERDAFIAPKPFPSWHLNEDTCQWVAPKAMPADDRVYAWDESLLRWV